MPLNLEKNMGKELNDTLLAIQQELKAPKGQYNSFGKYKYRSCEDILEAVKPLLRKYNCTLVISDDIVMLGTRFYIKATVTLSNGGETVMTTAFAREEEEKKGADSSQITGAASSYARKYALNGLFCIDDNKDSDTTNIGKQPEKKDTDENPIFDMACNDVRSAKTTEALKSIWNEYSSLQSNQVFKALVNKRKAELNGAA